ncbi:MAG TPA: caspase family protein [Bradyrhizobium sp.]|nr:caspase family protein [Bradyrhizobium sp.]
MRAAGSYFDTFERLTIGKSSFFKRLFWLATFFLALLSPLLAVSAAELAEKPKPVALLIANSVYPSDMGDQLKHPAKDARKLADELKRRGFEFLDVGQDLTREQMLSALEKLYSSIKPGSPALIYYSGYGIQSAGRSYMIPTDANIWSDAEVRRDGLDIQSVLEQMSIRGAVLKIAILDASRKTPWERNFRGRSLGLAPIVGDKGSIVIYSAAPNDTVVDDQEGETSLFMRSLLKEIQTPGLTVEQAFHQTRNEVSQATKGDQVPWVSSQMISDIFINPQTATGQSGQPQASLQSPADPCAAVETHWKAAEGMGTRMAYADHLARFGDCQFATLAQSRIEMIDGAAAQAAAQKAEDQKAAEEIARKAEQQKAADLAAARREAAQKEAEEAARKAEEQKIAEEAARKDAERKAAELAAAQKAAELKTAEQKAAQLAVQKADEQRVTEEAKRKALEQKAADLKAELTAAEKLAEQRAAEQRAAELAAQKATEQRVAEEAGRKAAEQKAAELATALQAAEKKMAAQGAADELARQAAERKAKEERAQVSACSMRQPSRPPLMAMGGSHVGGPWLPISIKPDLDAAKPIRAIEFSPDGAKFATAGDDGAIRLWDASNFHLLATLRGDQDPVYGLSFWSDGSMLASAGATGMIRVWDVRNGSVVNAFRAGSDSRSLRQFGVAFAPDRMLQYAVSVGDEGRVWIWDLQRNALRKTRASALLKSSADPTVRSISFAPDPSGQFVTAGFDGAIRFYVGAGEPVTYAVYSGKALRVAYSPDGRRVVSAGVDRSLKNLTLWDAKTHAVIRNLEGHADYVVSAAWSADGTRIVSGGGGRDHAVRIWDADRGTQLQTLAGHREDVESVAFVPGREWVVSVSEDKTLKLWDIASGRELLSLVTFNDGEYLAYTPLGCYAGSSGAEEHFKVVSDGSARDVTSDIRKTFYISGGMGPLLAASTR